MTDRVSQFRFRARDESEDWSAWIDRYVDGQDQVEFPDDDEDLEYQYRRVQLTEDGKDALVGHDWGKITDQIAEDMFGDDGPIIQEILNDRAVVAEPTAVPFRRGVVGPKIGDATVFPDGTFKATVADKRVADQLRGADPLHHGFSMSYAGGKAVQANVIKPPNQKGSPLIDPDANVRAAVDYITAQYGAAATTGGYLEYASTVLNPPLPHVGGGFVTKDSGKRAEYASGMVRDSEEGKAAFSLLLAAPIPYRDQLLTRWAELMERGARKYGKSNWLSGAGEEELERAKSSALRHMVQWISGERDEDHAAAVCANLMFAEYFRGKVEGRW